MSKKSNLVISVIILIVGIAIGGFLILSSKPGLAELSQGITKFFKGDQPQDPKLVDTDQDGLTDWQEEIYKTDPNNPDTDNDTYLDGEEVMSGYDPLVPAPDDKLSDKAINPRPKPGSMKGINLTEELSKAIIENLKNSSPDGSISIGSGSAEDIAIGLNPQASDIVDNALAAALAKSPQLNFAPIIQDKDIQISPDASRQAGQNYTDQVSKIISSNLAFPKLDIEAMQDAIQTKNYSDLDKYINGYKDSFVAIQALAAPINWKEIHKKNLSLIIASANIMEAIKTIDQDPMKAALALQQYQQVVLPGLKEIYEEGIKLIQAGK